MDISFKNLFEEKGNKMSHADQYKKSLSWGANETRPTAPKIVKVGSQEFKGYHYSDYHFEDGSVYCNILSKPHLSHKSAKKAGEKYIE